MAGFFSNDRGLYPPVGDAGAPGQYVPVTLSGTGTTEATNAAPFTKGMLYVLTVGSAPVRVLFSRTGGQSNFVPPTGGAILPANSVFPFVAVDNGTWGSLHVYVEAADGSSSYLASVFRRG